MRTNLKALGFTVLTAFGCSALLAGPKEDAGAEFPVPELAHLDFLIGVWKVEQKHLDPSGAVIATAEGTETITWILDKHAIHRIYRTKDASSTFEAIGLLTWSDAAKRFDGTWFDNASTAGPTRASGEWNEKERSFVFELQGAGSPANSVKYKTIDRFESDSSRLAVTYLMKGSEVVKVSEVRYTRTTPCPAKLRAVFNEF